MPCPCRYFIILFNSMFVTDCYFNAAEIFVVEPKGWGRKELFNPFCSKPNLQLPSADTLTYLKTNNLGAFLGIRPILSLSCIYACFFSSFFLHALFWASKIIHLVLCITFFAIGPLWGSLFLHSIFLSEPSQIKKLDRSCSILSLHDANIII